MKWTRIECTGSMSIHHLTYLGFFLLLYSAFPNVTIGQPQILVAEEYLRYLELGQRQMEAGDYKAADESFKIVLEEVDVLPAEICYFFGANSYYLKKYKQSINWLNKYIELKGTSGQYFEDCTSYLEKSEQAYRDAQQSQEVLENSQSPTMTDVDYSELPDIDCGPSGKVICPVCNGRTVIITSGKFRREYRTCPYCDEHGLLTCEEYNLLLKGELQPKEGRVVE